MSRFVPPYRRERERVCVSERDTQREKEGEGVCVRESLLNHLLRCSVRHSAMAGSSEKVPIASAGPEDLQQFMPPVRPDVKRGLCC